MSIRFVTERNLREYEQAGSPFAALLPDDPPAKQTIAWKMYGDLLESEGLEILDVGCGRSPLTVEMDLRHDYWPCDLVHTGGDWRDIIGDFDDVVIANDLFPNVDQGLAEFLHRWHGKAELRLSLTVYEDRIYRAKRIDGDEVLTVKAWDWRQTAEVLTRFGIRALSLQPPAESLFPNGRQVALLRC